MIKLIPNDILAIQMYSMANSVEANMSFSKEFLLHDNIFFMLGEPFSLGFDLISKKASKCKPRSEIKGDFKDAYQLESQSLPSAMINMIGNAFSQWLGFSNYDNAGVYRSLNTEGNRQLEPHNLKMELSDNFLIITLNGEQIPYETAVKCILFHNMVSESIPTIKDDKEEPFIPKKKSILSKMHDTFMEGFYIGFDKTTPKLGNSSGADILKEKGFLNYMKEAISYDKNSDDNDKRLR